MPKKKADKKITLTEYDKMILDKYTKYYTNFIESNTAKSEALEDYRYVPKK